MKTLNTTISSLTFGILCLASTLGYGQGMNFESMEKTLKDNTQVIAASGNTFHIKYQGFNFMVIADQENDQIKIISPTKMEKYMSKEDYVKIWKMNQNTANSSRFDFEDGFVWSSSKLKFSKTNSNELLQSLNDVRNRVLAYYGKTNRSYNKG